MDKEINYGMTIANTIKIILISGLILNYIMRVVNIKKD